MHMCAAGTGPAADSAQPTPALEPKSAGDLPADDNDTRGGMLEALQVRARDQMVVLLENVESSVLMEQVLLSSETKREGSLEKIAIAVKSTPADEVVRKTKVNTDTVTEVGEEEMGQAMTAAWTAGASSGDTAAAVGRQQHTFGMYSSRVEPTVSHTKANSVRAAGGDKAKLGKRYTQPSQAELKRLWLEMQVSAGVEAKEADEGCDQCVHVSNNNAHGNTHTHTHTHTHTQQKRDLRPCTHQRHLARRSGHRHQSIHVL